jgi:hypothetical protein
MRCLPWAFSIFSEVAVENLMFLGAGKNGSFGVEKGMKFESKQKPTTFAEALLGETGWLPEAEATASPVKAELTEKAVVLESFTRFAEEKIAESPAQEIRFEGGSLALKASSDQFFSSHFQDAIQWAHSFEKRLGAEVFQALVASKKAVKILFYVDELKTDSLPNEVSGSREFLYCFEKDVAELFEKMVKAMKLQTHEFGLSAVSLGGSPRMIEELWEEILWRGPTIVVPLGAQATQALLGNKERLASVHGKFYPLSAIKTKEIQIVPLFHPNVIATNQNMKKSTWADMQKIMGAMGLL